MIPEGPYASDVEFTIGKLLPPTEKMAELLEVLQNIHVRKPDPVSDERAMHSVTTVNELVSTLQNMLDNPVEKCQVLEVILPALIDARKKAQEEEVWRVRERRRPEGVRY